MRRNVQYARQYVTNIGLRELCTQQILMTCSQQPLWTHLCQIPSSSYYGHSHSHTLNNRTALKLYTLYLGHHNCCITLCTDHHAIAAIQKYCTNQHDMQFIFFIHILLLFRELCFNLVNGRVFTLCGLIDRLTLLYIDIIVRVNGINQ